MAPSRALSRVCTEQTQRCISNKRPVYERRRPTSEPLSSSRAFTTSISHQADESTPLNSVPRSQTPNKSSFGFPRPRQPKSIDLSTITSNPDYKPPEPRQPNPSRLQAINKDSLSSLDALLNNTRAKTPSPAPGSKTRTSFNADTYRKGGTLPNRPAQTSNQLARSLFDDDMFGKSKRDSAERRAELFPDPSRDLTREESVMLRLNPSLGKTVKLMGNFDLTRAFQTLEGKINGRGNSVKKDERAQKFHVRAGQAKKIARRARWRALFKQGYVAELGRVRKMIKQGW